MSIWSRPLKSRSSRRARGSASSTEFIYAISIFFLLAFFPLIDLMGMAFSYAIIVLLDHQIATRAAEQPTFPMARTAMSDEATHLLGTGLSNFLHLKPVGGFKGSGCDLYIYVSKLDGTGVQTIGPNKALTSPPTPDTKVYEYGAKANFSYSPMIPMSGIMFIKDVPGLGQPAVLTTTSTRAVENITGLATTGGADQDTGSVNMPDLTASLNGSPPSSYNGPDASSPYGWRHPGAYAALGNVIKSDIFIVPSNCPDWVQSQIQLTSNNQVYIDSHADGIWKGGAQSPIYDANGIKVNANPDYNNPAFQPNDGKDWRLFGKVRTKEVPSWGSLVGFVSQSKASMPKVTSPQNEDQPNSTTANNGYMYLGDNRLQQSTANGTLYAVFNDVLRDNTNTGVQVVRVLVVGN